MFRLLSLLCLVCLAYPLFSQIPQDAAVPLQISASLNPPAVLINWPNPAPSDLILRRRVKGAAGNTWVELVNAQQTQLDGYFDASVSNTDVYEYALERKTGSITAQGFGYANFLTPELDYLGKLLVFIDSTTADQLGADLATFKNGLRGEGWQILPYKTGPFTTVQWVKNQIVGAFNADPTQVKAVLLIGNVPVPYAGSLARDNQPDHIGAWPADAYYGDVNGSWTDNVVNIPNTTRMANRNVPGDGKFDQNNLPSAVELPVGRIDFRHLSAGTFGLPPVELIRRYLLKNHQYRTGQWKASAKALVDDHLGWSGAEAFASDGYRNAYPLVGAGQVFSGDFLSQSNPDRYILGYAAGNAGNYSGATGIGTAAMVAADTVNVVFAGLFGNYFGDWDYETNPLMPAFLAARGGVLACAWMGRPHWMLQGLATGENIGFCLKETQNAQYNTAYGDSNAESGTHINLLGDPTLRAVVVPAVSSLTAQSNCTKVNLHWTPPADPDILGYLVFRSTDINGPYVRVSSNLGQQTAWEDQNPVADTLFYAVRPLKLVVTPGGGAFYQTGSSPIQSVVFVPGTGPTAIGLGGLINCANPELTLGTNFQPPTSTYQWFKPDGQPLGGTTATEPGVYTVVVTAPNGCTVAAYATVYADDMLPELDFPEVVAVSCANPFPTFVVPDLGPNIQMAFNGTPVAPGQTISLSNGGVMQVYSTANNCAETYTATANYDITPPTLQISGGGSTIQCGQSTVQLAASTNVAPAAYLWSNGAATAAITAGSPGIYCCTVTAPNGCTSTACAEVFPGGTAINLAIAFAGDPCAPGEKTLTAEHSGGLPPYEYAWSNGATGSTVTLPGSFSGPVSVTVTDSELCSAQASVTVGTGVTLLAITDRPSTPQATDGSIDLLITGGQTPLSFLWSNGATTEDLSDLASGTYTVTVSDVNGCSTVLTIPLITTSSATSPVEAPGLTVFPNPAGAAVTVQVQWPEAGVLTLVLRDMTGKVVQEQQGSGSVFQLAVQNLPDGLYSLTVLGDRWSKVVKLVKQQ